MARYYPAFLNLAGRRVVVVGGGRVAYRKVTALLEAQAQCVVVSPKAVPGLMEMAENGEIQWIKDGFKEAYLDGAWLVVAATDEPAVQDKIYKACEAKSLFCNVVDVPERCSFIVPSIVRRGAFVIAISTSGLAPGLAKNIRKELESIFPDAYARYIECIGRLRQYVIEHYSEKDERARRLKILFDLGAARWFIDGDTKAVEQWALELGGKEALSIVREYYG